MANERYVRIGTGPYSNVVGQKEGQMFKSKLDQNKAKCDPDMYFSLKWRVPTRM